MPKISSVGPVPSVNVVRAAGKGLLSQSMGSDGGTRGSTVKFPSISKLPTVLPANVVRFATHVPIRNNNRKVVMVNIRPGEVIPTGRQYFWKHTMVAKSPCQHKR